MEPIVIRTYLPVRAAVGAGTSVYGEGEYSLTDADVQALTPQAREVIAADTLPTRLHVAAMTAEAVRAALEAHAEQRAAHAAEQAEQEARAAAARAADVARVVAAPPAAWLEERYGRIALRGLPLLDPVVAWSLIHDADVVAAREAVRPHYDAMVAARRAEQDAQAAADAARRAAEQRALVAEVAALVAEHGTAEQQARLAAGALPDDEVGAIVQRLLPDWDLPAYDEAELAAAMKHNDCDCASRYVPRHEDEVWNGPYTAEQWEALRVLREEADAAGVTVAVYCDTVSCRDCDAVQRTLSVGVSLVRAGHDVYRVYRLPGHAPGAAAPHVLVDAGWARAFAVDEPATPEDEERIVRLGNHGEPHNLDDAWIAQVAIDAQQDADVHAHVMADEDTDYVIEVTVRVLVYAARLPESDRDKPWLEALAADALRVNGTDPHAAGDTVADWRLIASTVTSGGDP